MRLVVTSTCLLAAGWFLVVASAEADSRIEKSGTVGLSGGGNYGVLQGNSRYGEDFDDGPGFNLALRYVLGPHWSMGLSFQSQSYGANAGDNPEGFDEVRMTDISFDTYFYRDRQADASQYVMVGIGFYRPEVHRSNAEISFPGENLRLSVGVGAEVFFRENWGLELGARAIAYFGDGLTDQERVDPLIPEPDSNLSYAFQGQVGILYYLLR